jgi:hypothetical protein
MAVSVSRLAPDGESLSPVHGLLFHLNKKFNKLGEVSEVPTEPNGSGFSSHDAVGIV